MNIIDIVGKRFNKLVAIRFVEKRYLTQQYWLFKCDCGNSKIINRSSVIRGITQSCHGTGHPRNGINKGWFKNGQISWNRGMDNPWQKGKPRSEEVKRKIAIPQMGEKNHYWKGDKVGYGGLHDWIRSKLGNPKQCLYCGTNVKLEWANKSGLYSRSLDDWLSLCRSCHKRYDVGHRGNSAIQARWPKFWEMIKSYKRTYETHT